MKASKKRFLNDVLSVIDEVEFLEKKIEIMELSMDKEETEENHVNVFMIEYGKKTLFEHIMGVTSYDYELRVNYNNGEIENTFEEWYSMLFKLIYKRESSRTNTKVLLPTSIPLDEIKKMLMPLAIEEYDKRKKEAQFEYLNSRKED